MTEWTPDTTERGEASLWLAVAVGAIMAALFLLFIGLPMLAWYLEAMRVVG